jgi:hypothetical protein
MKNCSLLLQAWLLFLLEEPDMAVAVQAWICMRKNEKMQSIIAGLAVVPP